MFLTITNHVLNFNLNILPKIIKAGLKIWQTLKMILIGAIVLVHHSTIHNTNKSFKFILAWFWWRLLD